MPPKQCKGRHRIHGFLTGQQMVVRIVGPAVNLMVENHDVGLNVLDLGWPVISTIAYGTVIGALILMVGLLFNILVGLSETRPYA